MPLHHQDHSVAHQEVRILMLVGVVAHADGAIGQIAEHAAAVFSGDDRLPPAARRMAQSSS